MKKVIIRADSNKIVAMGHVMRCLSVADALRDGGAEILFVCASNDPENLVKKRGYDVKVLNTDFSKMEDELPVICPILEQNKPDIIILDTYYLTDKYVESIKRYGKTVFIDDYGKDAFTVDILVNYNIYGKEIDYEKLYVQNGLVIPKLILGADYVPLRKEFINVKPINIRKNGPFEVLLSTGGADALGIAVKMCKKFLYNPIEDVRLNILVGPYSNDKGYLYNAEKENVHLIKIWENITDMPTFYGKFDLAMSAAGSTTYEICRMGIPAILFTTADNQRKINRSFYEQGIMESAGNAEENCVEVINNLYSFIKNTLSDYQYRVNLSEKTIKTIDGNGAKRIAVAIENVLG